MDLKNMIDKAFSEYEYSAELADLKEELLTNYQERLKDSSGGNTNNSVIKEIINAELADVDSIARELNLKKKKKVTTVRITDSNNVVSRKRAIIYTSLWVLIPYGMIVAALSYISSDEIAAPMGVLMVFFGIPVAGITYMRLTQETSSRYPISKTRALFYAFSVYFLIFGLLVFPIILFGEDGPTLEGALGALMTFPLISFAVLVYLKVTESNRKK